MAALAASITAVAGRAALRHSTPCAHVLHIPSSYAQLCGLQRAPSNH